MLFSIVIPTYNRLPLLQETLASVWSQQFTDYELIVVDDGSSDGTRDYLNSLGARVHVIIDQPNLGPGAARNAGAERAHGKYLAFLDSDDLWFPWTLKTFARLIDAYNSPAIISACAEFFTEAIEIEPCTSSIRPAFYQDYFAGGVDGYFVSSNMAVLCRENFLRAGGFHTHRINAEDHDLILRIGNEPGFVQILAPVTLGWRKHPASETKDLRKTFQGVYHLIMQERQGAYPGGQARARERRDIITLHVRPAALACLKQGLRREAWELYRSSFAWQAASGRWKFLFGFAAKSLWTFHEAMRLFF